MTNTDTPGYGLDPERVMELAWTMARCSSPTDRMYWEGELRTYLDASAIGSDTAGLPSDCAGLLADDSVAKVWDILVAGGWRPPVVPSSAISEAIAALSRAPEAVAWYWFDAEGLEHFAFGKGKPLDGVESFPLYATPPAPQPPVNKALKECLRVLQQTPDRLRSNAHKNAIGQARAALAEQGEVAQPAAAGWQPIETAPVNGDVVALAEKYCEGWCKENGGQGKFDDCTGCEIAALSASPPQGGSDE